MIEHGSKCIYAVLVSEVILEIVEGIELIECDGIVDSDRLRHLIDLDLEVCFDEKFNKDNERDKRSLNQNRRLHRKTLADACEEVLIIMPI